MHLSVPTRFRRRIELPKKLYLPLANLIKSDHEGIVPKEQIIQAIRDSLQRGLISRGKLTQIPQLLKNKNEYHL